jgi:hypothetical protein
MVNVIILSVARLNAILLSVFTLQSLYCDNAEWQSAECRSSELHGTFKTFVQKHFFKMPLFLFKFTPSLNEKAGNTN